MGWQRVIVTRPLAQALPWVHALQSAGVPAQALPLIDIAPPQDEAAVAEAWQGLEGLERRALAMFVSANAVDHFFALRPVALQGETGTAVAPWPTGLLAGSTGPGTSERLRAWGVPEACIVEPPPGAALESESLWRLLQGRDWAGRRVLVVRGEEGRDWLGDRLREAGALVDFVAAYRRCMPQPDAEGRALLAAAQADPSAHCWIFSSSEAVGHLLALAPGADWSLATALAPHPRIAQAARAAGFADVRLVGPGPQAVVGLWSQIQSAAAHPTPL